MKNMKIALVEDDINMRKSLEMAFAVYEEYEVKSFKNPKEALKALDDSFDMIVTDLTMPGMDGMEFVRELDGKYPVVVITGNATLNKAIDGIRLGVKDFIQKPFEIQTLISAINRAIIAVDAPQISGKIQKQFDFEPAKNAKPDGDFWAKSPSLDGALSIALKSAKTDASILLLGESGVGKELFAKYIHKNSPRASKPFIAINMAAIPDNLIESELFGYEKGAFTDAQAMKIGRFEMAHSGTLFLDEIAEMPFTLQSKLLRAIQDREITRLGSTKSIKIDVRIISATNVNIEKNIKEQMFREDLYYRLNTIPVKIPPLRERKDEILTIVERMLTQTAQRYNVKNHTLSDDAKEALLAHDWPGNIRELISVAERLAILTDDEIITAEDITNYL
jgi:two-component system, NtrC family, response regulator